MDISMTALTIGIGMAIAATFGAIGQSRAISGAVEAMARQPEAGPRIFTSLIVGLALIETLVIYTLLVTGFFLQGSLDKMIQAKYGKDVLETQKMTEAYDAEKAAKGGTH
ncbi:MAG: ATP synthase F0 subunit C [Planctomycetota bacterium]